MRHSFSRGPQRKGGEKSPVEKLLLFTQSSEIKPEERKKEKEVLRETIAEIF